MTSSASLRCGATWSRIRCQLWSARARDGRACQRPADCGMLVEGAFEENAGYMEGGAPARAGRSRRHRGACPGVAQKSEVTYVKEGYGVERITDDAGGTTSAVVKLARDIDESASDVMGYHLAENDYSFDALQAYCFGINIKL